MLLIRVIFIKMHLTVYEHSACFGAFTYKLTCLVLLSLCLPHSIFSMAPRHLLPTYAESKSSAPPSRVPTPLIPPISAPGWLVYSDKYYQGLWHYWMGPESQLNPIEFLCPSEYMWFSVTYKCADLQDLATIMYILEIQFTVTLMSLSQRSTLNGCKCAGNRFSTLLRI